MIHCMVQRHVSTFCQSESTSPRAFPPELDGDPQKGHEVDPSIGNPPGLPLVDSIKVTDISPSRSLFPMQYIDFYLLSCFPFTCQMLRCRFLCFSPADPENSFSRCSLLPLWPLLSSPAGPERFQMPRVVE